VMRYASSSIFNKMYFTRCSSQWHFLLHTTHSFSQDHTK
jgi:hypothetical protein